MEARTPKGKKQGGFVPANLKEKPALKRQNAGFQFPGASKHQISSSSSTEEEDECTQNQPEDIVDDDSTVGEAEFELRAHIRDFAIDHGVQLTKALVSIELSKLRPQKKAKKETSS